MILTDILLTYLCVMGTITGLTGIIVKLFQLWKEGKFR